VNHGFATVEQLKHVADVLHVHAVKLDLAMLRRNAVNVAHLVSVRQKFVNDKTPNATTAAGDGDFHAHLLT